MKSKHTIRQLAILVSAFIIFSLALPKLASATHAAGAAITYTHLTGNMYRLHFIFYRDCAGISAPTSVLIVAQSTSCGVSTNFNLLPLPGTGMEIFLPCNGAITTCSGGSTPGFQKWEYESDVAIPAQCADWVFSFEVCCLNGGTTQSGSDLFVESHLNNSVSDNSSPQFTNDPLLFSCINQDFHYNNGMFDPDGDSLVYHLIDAIGAIYIPPHTGQQPFISVPPVTFDYFTGDYFMHPTAQEFGPIAFEVLDYRNGVLMGSVIREITTITHACTNQNPTATEMNGTSQQIAYVFPTDTICFDIFSDDVDISDSVTMTWNQVIPTATFVTTTAIHPTGTFCWIPAMGDVRSNPYMFTSMVRDEYCPLNNAGVYSYYIYVTLDSSLVFLNANDPEANSLFSVSPNPSTGIFTIQSAEKFSQLKIFNAVGECILKKEFENRIDLSSQPKGIYFVEAIMNDGKAVRQKFVKD